MTQRSANLVPLKPYFIAGYGAFLAVVITAPLALFAPFWSFKFGPEWRAAIPDWASFHGRETLIAAVPALAYPVCVGGGLLIWAIQERNVRRYRRKRLRSGAGAEPPELSDRQ